jgi:glycosyltransferase involved in cell wall biosynthesis
MTRVLLAVSAGGNAMRRSVTETIVAARGRYTVRVLAPDREAQAIRPFGVPVESWKPAGLFNVLRSIGALRRAVERYDPDVIYAYGWTAAAVALGALPARFTARTIVYLQDPIRDGEMPKPFLEKRLPELLARSAEVVVTYEKLRRGLIAGFNVAPERISLDLPGVTPLTAPNLERAPGRHGPIVGYVGSLDAERAWEVAIDALAQLLPKYPHARLWFANGGRVTPLVRQHARTMRALDAITFYDDLPDGELFAGIDMLVTPRMRDGLPYAPLEALVSGIPFVASNNDGMGDVLVSYAGYLTPDTPEGIAAGIEGTWNAIDEAWANAAAQRAAAIATFDPEAAFARTFARWDRIAAAADASEALGEPVDAEEIRAAGTDGHPARDHDRIARTRDALGEDAFLGVGDERVDVVVGRDEERLDAPE